MRVLVVYKKSAYQLYIVERKEPRLVRLLRAREADALDMRHAHRAHQETLTAVVRALTRCRMPYDLVYRARLRTAARYDLVVSVGGDGTFLQASHAVRETPMLGVNSDPRRSEAVFCAATKDNVEAVLRQALSRRLPECRVYRLRLALNGRVAGPLILNDVLIAHEDPATMSRYRLMIGSRQEDHKSSGLWIASAAGSSSAILAAGGRRLPWTATRFQYRPRELYQGRLTRYRLTGGVLSMRERIELTWLMREGAAWIDGPHARFPLRFGDRVAMQLSLEHPLRILGIRHRVVRGT